MRGALQETFEQFYSSQVYEINGKDVYFLGLPTVDILLM